MTLISVHFPTYNQKNNIVRAIDSVYEQGHKNFEIIISDDCSTDGTVELLKSVSRNYDERLKIFFNKTNLGPVSNFNKILDNCRGDFVSFLTGDDYYKRDKFAKQLSWFAKNGSSAVLCGHSVEIDDDVRGVTEISKVRYWNRGFGAKKWIEHGPQYLAISIMVRRSSIPKFGFDARIPIVNDQKFWVDVIGIDGKYGGIADVLAVYNRTKMGLTANVRRCWDDLHNLYETLEIEYPQWLDNCKRGRVNQIIYGAAMICLLENQIEPARRKFLEAFRSNPRNVKPLVRLAQTFL